MRAAKACQALIGRTAIVVASTLLASCGGNPGEPLNFCLPCVAADADFYAKTEIRLEPASAVIRPGETVSTRVTVLYDKGERFGAAQFITDYEDSFWFVGADPVPPAPSSGLAVAMTRIDAVCAPAEAPSTHIQAACVHYLLEVTASAAVSAGQAIVVSAQWTGARMSTLEGTIGARVIERVATFDLGLPDYTLALSTPGSPKVYAPRGSVPLSVVRANAFGAPVDLAIDSLGNGLTSSLSPNPVPAHSSQLLLEIPARFGGGGLVPMRVTGNGGGLARTLSWTQRIEPIFTMALAPATIDLRNNAPRDIEVTLTFDPSAPMPALVRPIELSAPDLPPGVSAAFLPDAVPLPPVFPATTVKRTLRLSTDGSTAAIGSLDIRATALGFPSDLAGDKPYVQQPLQFDLAAGLQWEFVGNALSHAVDKTDTVGIAMQGNGQPAIAWLEGWGSGRRLYMRRYDGVTFAPSPPLDNALRAPAGFVLEASLMLTRSDVAKVAFTYDDGAQLALGSAGPSWTVGAPIVLGDASLPGSGRARSPRIAAGPADALTVAYIAAPTQAATGGALLVRRSANGLTLGSPLAGPHPNASLNADPGASALRDTVALAVRADGQPWLAWIEQPADTSLPAVLWLRGYDGSTWGNVVRAPSVRPLVRSGVQMLVEPSGSVVVAWLEGSPAQLKVARLDPASGTWTSMANTGNSEGSLNIGSGEPARDVSLARDASGRLVVAWTEGGLRPRVWVKRQNADTSWGVVGTAVSAADEATEGARIVSDPNDRLHVAWSRYYGGTDPSSVRQLTDVYVARWIYP